MCRRTLAVSSESVRPWVRRNPKLVVIPIRQKGLSATARRAVRGRQCAEIICAVELGNTQLLLKLKAESELGVGKGIPKEWEKDSLYDV